MRPLFAALLISLAVSAASARSLKAEYDSVADALKAAANAPILSTLLAAVTAADLSIPDDAKWTIFAPTNKAFEDKEIKAKTGLTAAQLLLPKNKDVLVKLLSYHVVPAAAVKSSDLKDGQVLKTALKDAKLVVDLVKGKVFIKASACDTNAEVVTADIKAGKSIVHVIDKVLIPKSLVA